MKLGGMASGKAANNFAAPLSWNCNQSNSCVPDVDSEEYLCCPEDLPCECCRNGGETHVWLLVRAF